LDEHGLEALRNSGGLRSQRCHVWSTIAHVTRPMAVQGQPLFESWYGEDEVFASDSVKQGPKGIRGFSRVSPADDGVAAQSADAPILTYTLYNAAAYNHIRRNRLQLRSELETLRKTGTADATFAGNRSVPAFPSQAIVLKTAWWPVAQHNYTALPVWDPELNPPRYRGNGYIGWRRVVAVDPDNRSRAATTVSIDFAGRSFPNARRVALESLYHVVVDAELAGRTMRDKDARKAALIALGRPLQEGDFLVLVGAHLATREIPDWVWGTFWWHDRPDLGPFAMDRPSELKPPWRNYLMQAALDADKPAAADGGPHICFNPWLEGRFPDGGHGGGVTSNCVSCHRRASYPAIDYLPVTRGAPDPGNDAAYATGRLRTNFLWSIPLHARP
jgi:hypothetical protein